MALLGKKVVCTAFAVLMALTASLGAAAEGTGKLCLDDSADLLTQEEEARITEEGEALSQKIGVELYIKTSQETGKPNRDDLTQAYSDLGHEEETSAVLMLMDGKHQKMLVSLVNTPIEDLPPKMISRMENNGRKLLEHNDYVQAALGFLQDVERAASGDKVVPAGKIVLISLGASAVITLMTVGTLTFMHPRLSRHKVSASHYLNDGKIQIYNSKDELVSSSTELEQQQQTSDRKKVKAPKITK